MAASRPESRPSPPAFGRRGRNRSQARRRRASTLSLRGCFAIICRRWSAAAERPASGGLSWAERSRGRSGRWRPLAFGRRPGRPAGRRSIAAKGDSDTVKPTTRIGIGHDTHRLAAPGPLRLGGVSIPHDRHLVGHSDADVLLHAVTDALLGAAAIGRHRRVVSRHGSGEPRPRLRRDAAFGLRPGRRGRLLGGEPRLHGFRRAASLGPFQGLHSPIASPKSSNCSPNRSD